MKIAILLLLLTEIFPNDRIGISIWGIGMDKKKKEIIDTFERMIYHHVEPMNEEEYRHAFFVAEKLDSIPVVEGDISSLEEVKNELIRSFMIYGCLIQEKAFRLLQTVTMIQKDCSTISCFQTHIDTRSEHFKTSSITTPKTYTTLSSYYLCHEIHHALKDTHKKEYQYMLRYADVIPMFYEFVSGKDKSIKNQLIKNRLSLLEQCKTHLEIKRNRVDKNLLWDFVDSKNAQYFNSFYYAILLYQTYLNHPKEVLQDISSVLLGELTTYQLLEKYGLFQKNYDTSVEEGIKVFQKRNF